MIPVETGSKGGSRQAIRAFGIVMSRYVTLMARGQRPGLVMSQHPTVEFIVARALAESSTLAEAARRVLQAICEALGWDHGALWNVDDSSGVLRCVEMWHLPGLEHPEFAAASRSLAFSTPVSEAH